MKAGRKAKGFFRDLNVNEMQSSHLYLLSKGLARIVNYTLGTRYNSRRLRLVLAVERNV